MENTKKSISGYYNKMFLIYDELYGSEQEDKFKVAKGIFDFKGLILDVGCGNGNITNEIKDAVGIDISFDMLKSVKRAVMADAECLPFKDKTFNHAVSFTVLQDTPHPKKMIEEMRRVSKGDILISVLNKTWGKKRFEDLGYKVKKYKKGKKDIFVII
ncbi:MAG: class I SAM-dependent methyltransferase [Candidatus Nanoarchaeia archaeon]|nr:class I SAM-dependent methyltransferase [Candidatus Nanoarchaeia archaeon]